MPRQKKLETGAQNNVLPRRTPAVSRHQRRERSGRCWRSAPLLAFGFKQFTLSIASVKMPRKVRELIHDLRAAGFYEIPGGGKGAHRKFTHTNYPGAVTLSGQTGDDAKPYQERQVRRAIEQVQR